MTTFQAILLAIIEGITEFLPVSSTGHMVVGASAMGIASASFTKLFIVAIQLGAILSVVAIYWKNFFRSINFYVKLFVAFIPAAIVGLLLKKHIDALLENVLVVAIVLLLGGILLLFVDKWFATNDTIVDDSEADISHKKAFVIGIFQAASAIAPGLSRSASTIVGGLSQKLSRKTAAEFSFFLAVPTMFAATAKDLYDYIKDGNTLTSNEISLLAIGNIVAFVVALLAIRSFVGYVSKNGFKVFGWYRIAIGAVVIILYFCGHYFGLQLQMV